MIQSKRQGNNFLPRILILLLLGITTLPSTWASIYGYYAQSRLYLGAGHNPYNPREGYVKCIAHQGSIQENTNGAVESEVHLRMIKSREEIYNFLNVSTAMSGGISFFRGNYSLNLLDERAFQSDSLTWMVLFKSDFGNFTLNRPRLAQEYQSLDQVELYRTCGSEIVTEERRGAMVFALFTLKNLSTSQKRELEHKLSLGLRGTFWNAQMDATYKSLMRSLQVMSDVSFTVKTMGGNGVSDLGGIIGEDFSDFSQIPAVMREYIKKISPQNSSPLYFITTHLSSFVPQLPLSYHQFQEEQAGRIYQRIEDLAPQARRMHEMLDGPEAEKYQLSPQEREELGRNRNLYHEAINTLVSIGKKCFTPEEDHQCLLPSLSLPQIPWGKLTKNYKCESLRLEAYLTGQIPLEYYHMAKKHGLFPLLEGGTVVGYESCDNLL